MRAAMNEPTPTEIAAPRRAAGVTFIFFVLLLDTLGIGVIIPVLPRLITSLCGGDLGQGSRFFGVFVAVYAVMQVIFAPILGALGDRFGRRPVILGSLLGAALDYLLLAFAPSLAWLFVGRVISGITGASFSTATAYIADVTTPEKRAQSFGLVGAAFGIGFILGPALGGFLGGTSLRAPFLVAAGLNALNLLYGVFVLPESLSKDKRRPFSIARANPFGALRNLGRTPMLLGLTGTLATSYLAQQILQAVWALHMEARFAWSTLQVGGSLAVVGLMSGLVQGVVVRAAVPRLGERRALTTGLVFNIAGYVLLAIANQGWMIYVILIPFSLGGLGGPATQALLTREVGPSEQGELQGSLTSLQSLAAIAGPLIGTALFSRFATEHSTPRIPGIAFFACAALNLVGLALALLLFSKTPPPAKIE
jgi:DHA1 family tetracycline resistance protein-like MFS transporter